MADIFGNLVEYFGKGDANIKIPHIKYKTSQGIKIIYVCGYSDKRRWEKALGGQIGCLYIDEVNIADMEFVREASHRCEYELTSSNPDDPNLAVYKEYINKSRPLEKYINNYPVELLKELKEQAIDDWTHWYFTFEDNPSLTTEQIQDKKNSLDPKSKMYKNKILGLRGKATGLCLNIKPENIITVAEAKKMQFKIFSIGCDTSYSKKSHDKLTIEGVGITADGKCVLLKERGFNNKDRTIPFAPSDVVKYIIEFMEEFKNEWGFARNCFIDCADQGTLMEAAKTKRQTGCIYDFKNSWKQTKVITRIQLESCWLTMRDFLIVDTCTGYLNECDIYSYNEDNQPEDANDHHVNGCQYAWLPYKKKIGNWKILKDLVKDNNEDMEE